jgi:hypothetical protein
MGGSVEKPNISEEMEKIPYEPLLPIEKKLIVWSLAVGIVLMAILIFLSRAYFPVAG